MGEDAACAAEDGLKKVIKVRLDRLCVRAQRLYSANALAVRSAIDGGSLAPVPKTQDSADDSAADSRPYRFTHDVKDVGRESCVQIHDA